MKRKLVKYEHKGLPGGPNEQFSFSSSVFSTDGYKRNSPDVNNPFNIIPSGNITMKDVDFPVLGIDNLGNSKMMQPGFDYQFPGNTVFELPMAQRGIEVPIRSGANFNIPVSSRDSVQNIAGNIIDYEILRGGPGGTPLPFYSQPQYMSMLMNDIYPEVKKIMPNASAMEIGEAMDFIFNTGWDKINKKIKKDPRAYALQEYYRQYDRSKLDSEGNWSGRRNNPYSFDEEYANTIGKLPENERRILMNKGRDWYYQNINNPAPGVPNQNYYDTWYGRIWNTNEYAPFNPNNPKFTPTRQRGGESANENASSLVRTPYTGPRQMACPKEGCATIVRMDLEKMLPSRGPAGSLGEEDAWYKKAATVRGGGAIIWENPRGLSSEFDPSELDYSQLQVGDMVSLWRGSDAKKNLESQSGLPMTANEGNEHVGYIIGFDTDGTPLIKHGAQNGMAYVQRIDETIGLPAYGSFVGASYTPVSIYRAADFMRPQTQEYINRPRGAEDQNPEELIFNPRETYTNRRVIDAFTGSTGPQARQKNRWIDAINNAMPDVMNVTGLGPQEVSYLGKLAFSIPAMESSFDRLPSRLMREGKKQYKNVAWRVFAKRPKTEGMTTWPLPAKRNGFLELPGEGPATHQYEWGSTDNGYVVYPTLFQTDNGEWYQVPKEQTFEEAKKRGEVIEFDNKRDAELYATDGIWKGQYDWFFDKRIDTSPSLGPTQIKYDDIYGYDNRVSKKGAYFDALGVKRSDLTHALDYRSYPAAARATMAVLAADYQKLREDPTFNPETNTVFNNVPISDALYRMYSKGSIDSRGRDYLENYDVDYSNKAAEIFDTNLMNAPMPPVFLPEMEIKRDRQRGGEPIYVTNPNDPRYKAYQDSLHAAQWGDLVFYNNNPELNHVGSRTISLDPSLSQEAIFEMLKNDEFAKQYAAELGLTKEGNAGYDLHYKFVDIGLEEPDNVDVYTSLGRYPVTAVRSYHTRDDVTQSAFRTFPEWVQANGGLMNIFNSGLYRQIGGTDTTQTIDRIVNLPYYPYPKQKVIYSPEDYIRTKEPRWVKPPDINIDALHKQNLSQISRPTIPVPTNINIPNRQYKEENGRYFMRMPGSQTPGALDWRPVTKRTYELGQSKTMYQYGGRLDDEWLFQQWRKSLPYNLQADGPDYNLREAWKGDLVPEYVNTNNGMEWHLGSRNPITGELLKSPNHPSYDMMIESEIRAGYTPTIDARTGKLRSFQNGAEFNWTPIGGQQNLSATPSINPTYNVTATDGSGVKATTNPFNIQPPSSSSFLDAMNQIAPAYQQPSVISQQYIDQQERARNYAETMQRLNQRAGNYTLPDNGEINYPSTDLRRSLAPGFAGVMPNWWSDNTGYGNEMGFNLFMAEPFLTTAGGMWLDPKIARAGQYIANTRAGQAAGRAASQVGDYLTTQTPLKNAYKYNPWAFKPNPEAYYHRSPNIENIINQETRMLQGFGESSVGKAFTESTLSTKGINLKKGANSQLYFSKGVPLDYGRYNMIKDPKTGKLIPGQGYKGPYLVEVEGVPMGASTKGRAPGAEPTKIGSYAVSKRPISLDEAKFYKEDWLRGYKPVEAPRQLSGLSNAGRGFKSEIDWRNWVKYKEDFDNNPQVIQELIDIEKRTKADGTWMKNPDGSPFQGTPEQFVVQQSSRFKNAFKNVLRDSKGNILTVNHNSPNELTEFTRKYFGSTTDMGDKGVGTYVSPINPNPYASYGDNSYKLYVNSENPLNASSFIDKNIPPSARKGLADNYLKWFHRDLSEKAKARGINNYLDKDLVIGDEFYPNINENSFEMVVPFTNRMKSAVGNILFDMSNPNIYKALIPGAIGAGSLGSAAYNELQQPVLEFKKGGSTSKVTDDMLLTYKNYINNQDNSKEAEKIYDKLNRVYRMDAKKANMSIPNYIMTRVIK